MAKPPAKPPAAPRFFAGAAAFRAWLERHHADVAVLVVGFHHRASGRGGLTYPEALDEALCFGWIDGVRHGLGGQRYAIRFTPRRPGSVWSHVNVGHVARLEREGRMTGAGRAAFAARDPRRTVAYSAEQRRFALTPEFERRLAAAPRARTHFEGMPQGYRRAVTHWIMSAKLEATRERRFATLLDCSRRGRKVPPLDFPAREPAAGRRAARATPSRKA